jgi:deoxyuridine triphosphatase domain protein
MSVRRKIKEMFELQCQLNEELVPDWLEHQLRFENAIIVEVAELIDCLGYKWWKYQEVDTANARVEIVDIWHFVMSYVLREDVLDPNSLPEYIEKFSIISAQLYNHPYHTNIDHWVPVMYCARQLVREVESKDSVVGVLEKYFSILEAAGMTIDSLYSRYIIKNALNKVRMMNGYQDGTYIKDWKGMEDNHVATEMLFHDTPDYDTCVQKLNDYYNTQVK